MPNGLAQTCRAGLRIVHFALSLLLAGCSTVLPTPALTQPGTVTVTISADGQARAYSLPSGLTVREALAQSGLALGELDRLSSPPYTLISDGLPITVTRITESFETEEAVLPFASDIVKSDTLPEGQRKLLQPGENGQEEITYRTVFEDGVQVSRSVVKRVVVQAPVREIIMVGSQASYTIIPITGTLAYLNGGNAWLIRKNSGQRLPVTFSSDLDGHVFDLSPDGQWLLFTRALSDSATFNTLWALPVTSTLTTTQPIELKIRNVLYAEWTPSAPPTRTLAYSTAEKITRAPGWQANNDLWLLHLAENRRTRKLEFTPEQILDTSSGGLYGWWGTGFAASPDGASIAYARTDSIGLIDLTTKTQAELAQFTAFNTHSDWAWYPKLRWEPGGQFLYAVTHGPPLGLELPEDSPVFNLTGLSRATGLRLDLIPRAGMFANPAPSPAQTSPTGERRFRVAYLQADEPDNSPFSRYRLGVMDRDGSNARLLFPPADQPGLSNADTLVAWSPDARLLAVIYEGNLWLIDPDAGVTQQLTGDGLSELPEWER
jgi:hypothetical protein